MKKVLWLAVLIFLISGCSNNTENKKETENSLKIYYINNSETKIVYEAYEPKTFETNDLINELLIAIEKEPKENSYKLAKPDTIKIKNYEFKDGQLSIHFDSAYLSLSKTAEILCRASIVKTLCQIEDVKFVEFYVNEQPLMDSAEKPVGLMTKDKFIDNTGNDINYYQRTYVTLFFANDKGSKLIENLFLVTYDGNISMEEIIINRLISPGVDYVNRTIPEGTQLIKLTVKDGVCYLDFNEKLLDKTLNVKESVTIYSIVNSLVELPTINKVQFTINGEKRKTFRDGSIAFDEPFERNLDVVGNEE